MLIFVNLPPESSGHHQRYLHAFEYRSRALQQEIADVSMSAAASMSASKACAAQEHCPGIGARPGQGRVNRWSGYRMENPREREHDRDQ